jgi:indolepyruvate decarboxylase
MTSRLFAYGTLMPRDATTAIEQGWSADAVRGRLFDLGPYPALVDLDDPAAAWVEGYVREIVPAELESHDRWEDVDHGLYRRDQTTTRSGLSVWVYVYARPLPRDARGPLNRWKTPVHAQ